jgi:hypothetical protein
MYNYRNTFFFDNKSYSINSLNEFKSLLEEIVSKYSIKDSLFIKKTYWSYGGDQIFKFYLNEISSDSFVLADLYTKVIKHGYLFQETIHQHPVMNLLNPYCVNSIRMATFMDKNGEVEVINAYIRTSFQNHYVDNIGSGGCRIGIDLHNGKLEDFGYMSLKYGGMKLPSEHPLTHTKFHFIEIPYFKEALQLVTMAAKYIPSIRLVGWDVAISENGPILIEGNSDYDVAGTDLMTHGIKSNPVFRKALQEIHYI